MQDVYKNIDEYNADKERKILIVFDDMIADLINNKKLNSIVTELFIRGRKLNISIAFITQSYFKVPKDVRLNSTHFFIMKIPNKRKLQQIELNHSSAINSKSFIKIYKKWKVIISAGVIISYRVIIGLLREIGCRNNVIGKYIYTSCVNIN